MDPEYCYVINQPLIFVDPDGRYTLPPPGGWNPLPPLTGGNPGLISKIKPWWVCACFLCEAGVIQIEAQCANYGDMGYLSYKDCLCDFYDSNALLQIACDACLAIPALIDVPELLGCKKKYLPK